MRKILLAAFFCAACLMQSVARDFPAIMGHRGFYNADGVYENTMAALENAQKAKLDAIEFDVHITPDDGLVILHGPMVPGTDKNIQSLKLKDIRRMMLPGGHRIPELRDFLTQARKTPGMRLFLEMKEQRTEALEEKMVRGILAEVDRLGMEDQMVYISFRRHLCETVLKLRPKAKVWLITASKSAPAPAELKALGYSGITYSLNALLNKSWLVEELHALGMEACLWQVNERDLYTWAIQHSLDWITSDIPDKVAAYRQSIRDYHYKKPQVTEHPAPRALPHLMAHRGFCGSDGKYENSIYALRVAQERGYESIEFDVQLTADDSLIIYHGPFVRGTKQDVRTMTFEQIRAIPTPEGLGPIPTLREYLAQVRKYPSITMFLEMKHQLDEDRQCVLARKVVEQCDAMGVTPQIKFISGWRHLCEQILKLRPGAPVWLIAIVPHATTFEEIDEMKKLGYTGITYLYSIVLNRPWLLDYVRSIGMETCVYQANDPAMLDWAAEHGCKWITTDNPEACRNYMDAIRNFRMKP